MAVSSGGSLQPPSPPEPREPRRAWAPALETSVPIEGAPWTPPPRPPEPFPDAGERRRAIVLAVALVVAAAIAALGLRAAFQPNGSSPTAPALASPLAASSAAASPGTPGPTPSPSPSASASTVFAVGQDVPVGNREVHTVERAERWESPPDEDAIYVAIRVVVRATAPNVPFDSTYYQLRDGGGTLARPIPNGRQPVLAYGRLEAIGDRATGWITFETTTRAPYRLTYVLPLGANGELATIAVEIPSLSPTTPEPTTTPVPTPSAAGDPNPAPPGIPNWGYPTSRTSTFYAGYGATRPGASVSFVEGSWVQPTGTCSGTSTTAFSVWVGIDDNGIGNLEQLGTEIQCIRGSRTPMYGTWYEMFPEVSRRVSMRAAPGDRFTASVTNRGSSWILRITNRTTGQRWSITRTRDAEALQALWVAEAPSSQVSEPGLHVLPLTKFGSVTMSGCSAIVGGVKRSIGNAGWAHYRFDMVARDGTPKTSTSRLSGSGGTAFTVRWRHD